jgi:hypothetical protein
MMKAIPTLILLIGLLSCGLTDVTPEDISQLEYRMVGGFAGVEFTFNLNDTQQRFQTGQCEKAISYADWRTLITDFNATDYKNLPEKVEPECCDQFFYSLNITTGRKTYHREWSSFSHSHGRKLPQSIAKIDSVLSQRAWTEAQACR